MTDLVPYDENKEFVGRSEILAKLQRQLGFGQRPRGEESLSTVPLYGLGGVGCVMLFPYLLQAC